MNTFRNTSNLNSQIENDTNILSYVPLYVEHVKTYGRSELTARNVVNSLNFFIKSTEITTVERLNDNLFVADWLVKCHKDRSWSPATHNSYRKNLTAFVNYLLSINVVKENMLSRVKKMKETRKRTYYLKDEDLDSIYAAIEVIYPKPFYRLRNRLIVQFFALTGLRPSELVSIKLQDLDIAKGELAISTKKNGVNRNFSLPVKLIDTLRLYLIEKSSVFPFPQDQDYLFISVKGARLGLCGIRKLFEKIELEIGVEVCPYDMRRFVASRLERKGLAIAKISKYLGHNSISTTRRYLENSVYQTQEGVNLMADLIR